MPKQWTNSDVTIFDGMFDFPQDTDKASCDDQDKAAAYDEQYKYYE